VKSNTVHIVKRLKNNIKTFEFSAQNLSVLRVDTKQQSIIQKKLSEIQFSESFLSFNTVQ
jgi:hypothetical protein